MRFVLIELLHKRSGRSWQQVENPLLPLCEQTYR